MNISCTSRSRATRPLIRYSLCPERYNLRLTTTSPGFIAKTGLSTVFFRRFPLTNSGSAAVSSALGATSASEGAASCIPSAAASIGPSLFSVPSVLVASVNSVLIPWFSPALSSTNRAASASSGSSIVIITSANPIGGRFVVPLKMQSAIRSARSDLWLCSPSTQEIASTTLDFPHPFGPTMQVDPVPLNVTTVRSQNDLKPTISTFRSLSKLSPLVPHRTPNLRLARHPNSRNHSFPSLGGGAQHPCATNTTDRSCNEKRSFIFREGVTVDDNPTVTRSPVKTFGRFSIRGPAAWRVDGGTGKNTNTIPRCCKAYRNRW